MSSILREIYNGKQLSSAQKKQSTKQKAIVDKMTAEETYFKAKLTEEDGKRFEEYMKLHSVLSALEEEDIYAQAFSYGLLIGMDVLGEVSDIED